MPSETPTQSPKQPDIQFRLSISKMMALEFCCVQVVKTALVVAFSRAHSRPGVNKARIILILLITVVLVLHVPLPPGIDLHPSKHELPVESQLPTNDSVTTNVPAKAIQPLSPKLGPGVIVEFKKKYYKSQKGFYTHPFVIIDGPDSSGMVKLRLITSFRGKTREEALSSTNDSRDPGDYLRLPCLSDNPEDAQHIEIELRNNKKMPKRCYIEFAKYTTKHHVHMDRIKMYDDDYIVCTDDSLTRLVHAINMVAKSN